MYSIIYHVNSDEFPRVRCGIRQENMPAGSEMAAFVLSQFEQGERKTVMTMVERAADAATEAVVSGIAQTMNKFNRQ